mmetsp:Transcript_14903/g.40866  ORF Transcript_14903/g.40866 Transcript_14903/m.40866 type:complete len:490 (-) Transcript_14903:930-2399(-)
MHPHEALWDVFVLALAEQLSLAKLVNAEAPANAGQEPALEGEEAERHVVQRSRMDELQVVALVVHVGFNRGLGRMPRVQRHVVDGPDDQAGLVRKLREVAHREAQRRLVDIQVELEDGGEARGVDNSDARAPLAFARLEGTNLALRQVLLFVVLVLNVVHVVVDGPRELDLLQRRTDLAFGLLVVGVVVRLQHRQHDRVAGPVPGGRQRRRRQRDEAARRVGQIHDRLVEELAQTLAGDNPERVPGDGHETLRALLGREGGRVLELLVAHGGAVVLPLEVVAQPGLRAQRKHRGQTLDHDLVQTHRLRPQEPRPLVAQRAGNKIDDRADQDAAAQSDAEEEAVNVLALAHRLHLQKANALSRRLQGLGAKLLQRSLALKREDADRVVHAAHGHEGRPLAVVRHRLHREAQDLVIHVTLGDLVQCVALVDLEVQDLAAGQRDDDLLFVRGGCDDSLLTRDLPLVRAPRQQVSDACRVHLHVRIVSHQLDE